MRALSLLVLTLAACSSPPAPSAADDSGNVIEEDAAEPTLREYPEGPYGIHVGQTFPDFALEGYRDGKGAWTTLRLRDLYDPTGEKGLTAIYLSLGAAWCPGCQAEANSLPAKYPSYRKKGARFFSVLLQAADHSPATQTTVDQWLARYPIDYDIAADGDFSVFPAGSSGSIGLPYDMAIDPRTMKITYVKSGPLFLGSAGFPGVDELVAKNSK
jgi:peroxiredoxin